MGCHYIAIEGSRSRFSFSTKLQLNGQWTSSHLSVHWLLCHGSFADNKMQLRRPSKVMQGRHILLSLGALRESRLMLSLLLKVLHREWVIAAVKAPFVVYLLFNSSFNVHPTWFMSDWTGLPNFMGVAVRFAYNGFQTCIYRDRRQDVAPEIERN